MNVKYWCIAHDGKHGMSGDTLKDLENCRVRGRSRDIHSVIKEASGYPRRVLPESRLSIGTTCSPGSPVQVRASREPNFSDSAKAWMASVTEMSSLRTSTSLGGVKSAIDVEDECLR